MTAVAVRPPILDRPTVALALFAYVRNNGASSMDEMDFIVCAAARCVLGDELALPVTGAEVEAVYSFVNGVLADLSIYAK